MPTDHADPAVELQAVWDELLPGQPEMGARVIARYAEPHRAYHDQRHLADVIRWVGELSGEEDLFLVRLGAFFHDAVYAIPPGQVTNEEASARLARRELASAGLEQEDINEVARLVRVTATHAPGQRDPEGELICDADLAVLAGSPEDYRRYVDAVRSEYAAVPRETFAAGRLEILTDLLRRDLFRTGKGRLLEDRARANVEAEATELAAELGLEDWEPPVVRV